MLAKYDALLHLPALKKDVGSIGGQAYHPVTKALVVHKLTGAHPHGSVHFLPTSCITASGSHAQLLSSPSSCSCQQQAVPEHP